MIRNKINMINIALMILNWLIQSDFIGMKNHCDTLFYDVHTLELMLN